ncbi:alpha/beta hydrolase fold domain-containing protein [Fodinicola acaciae]|uniref:alpha/beta hydrolase fold domain-containing protein n=1 Tax=Fodinicola acaciae TaxID=2681555 RepID=UPI0013D51146|nr:alpha/beta hydrolase fold domain-containing protein [Fodinicola acaciae]
MRVSTEVARAVVSTVLRPVLSPRVPPSWQRRLVDASCATMPMPKGVRIAHGWLDGVPGRVCVPDDRAAGVAIVYLHGGGYVTGSSFNLRALAASLAKAARATTFVPDYRRAPEHPYPSALRDTMTVIRAVRRSGYPRVALAGDSAGAGLALAAAMRLRDGGEPTPTGIAAISPWVDLTLAGESYLTKAAADPLLTEEWLRFCACAYAASVDLTHPEISPLFADLRGLPPLVIQAGTEDVLLSDADRLAEAAAAAGVRTEYRRFPGLWHDFQQFAGVLSEADEAIAALARHLTLE